MPVSQQIWTPPNLDPAVQIRQRIWTPRSKSASEYGPPGDPIRQRIWTPFADLDPLCNCKNPRCYSHIKYRNNFTFQSWRRNVSFGFQNTANLFIIEVESDFRSSKLTVRFRHIARPLNVAVKARAAVFLAEDTILKSCFLSYALLLLFQDTEFNIV